MDNGKEMGVPAVFFLRAWFQPLFSWFAAQPPCPPPSFLPAAASSLSLSSRAAAESMAPYPGGDIPLPVTIPLTRDALEAVGPPRSQRIPINPSNVAIASSRHLNLSLSPMLHRTASQPLLCDDWGENVGSLAAACSLVTSNLITFMHQHKKSHRLLLNDPANQTSLCDLTERDDLFSLQKLGEVASDALQHSGLWLGVRVNRTNDIVLGVMDVCRWLVAAEMTKQQLTDVDDEFDGDSSQGSHSGSCASTSLVPRWIDVLEKNLFKQDPLRRTVQHQEFFIVYQGASPHKPWPVQYLGGIEEFQGKGGLDRLIFCQSSLWAAVGDDPVRQYYFGLLHALGLGTQKKPELGTFFFKEAKKRADIKQLRRDCLTLAIGWGQDAAARYLLNKTGPDQPDSHGVRPLAVACLLSNEAMCKELIKRGANPSRHGDGGNVRNQLSAFWRALYLAMLSPTPGGCTATPAIPEALQKSRERILDMVLAAGADTNQTDPTGQTVPLIEAARSGALRIFDKLLLHGAKLDRMVGTPESGYTSVAEAVFRVVRDYHSSDLATKFLQRLRQHGCHMADLLRPPGMQPYPSHTGSPSTHAQAAPYPY